ncbi:MAG: FecR family protein, partial [Thermodesulfobacteriota bacterium]|nr:FecR family protein [Thermodesulfobacteriota bacterium]
MDTSKRINALVLGALIILTAGFFLLSPASAQAASKVGTVTVLKGRATITHKGRVKADVIRVGTSVYQFDTIRTQPGGKLRVVFADRSIISVSSNSSLTISEYVYSPAKKVRSGGLKLLFGKVKCFVNDLMGYRSRKFNVTTSTAVIGVRGTVFLVWVVNDRITRVAAFQNMVEVANAFNPDQYVILQPGTMTQIKRGEAP